MKDRAIENYRKFTVRLSESKSAKKKDSRMTYFLAKTDPETYSIDDLERDKRTAWDGVTNPQAVRAIRAMHAGDRIFIYNRGLGVVGMAVATSESRDDPKNPKAAVVDLEY